jgi:predicted aldo/keto reductase-like oxidoreductase
MRSSGDYYWSIRFSFDANKNSFIIHGNKYQESSSLISEEEIKRILLKAIEAGRTYIETEPN